MEDQIKECITILRTSTDNQEIQHATSLISQFIQEPNAIDAFSSLYSTSVDQYDRQHALIYLIKSIQFSWKFINNDDQLSIFNMMKDILIKEQIWFLRNLIIGTIEYIVTSSQFYEPLLTFISEAAEDENDENLLIAINLTPIIQDINEPILDLIISMLERGFSYSGEITQLQLEIKISSLHCLSYLSPKLIMNELFDAKFPSFWESSIEILDYYETDYNLLKRITNYFIFSLHLRLNLDPLLLLQKVLQIFNSIAENDEENVNVLLLLFNVIQNICHFYPADVLNSDSFSEIVDLSISLSSFLYEPDDSLSLSYSDFFESVYSDLCTSDEVLQVMWDSIFSSTLDESGQFFTCCILHATLHNFPSFFDDKLDDILELLCNSVSNGGRLLCEAAVRTMTVFVGLFEKDLEASNEIINLVLEACQNDTSSCLLLYLAQILNVFNDSEEMFDDAFPFLMDVLTSGSFELRNASLSALSALCCGSTVKINVNFMEIFNALFEIIQSSGDPFDQLKPSCIEALAQIISTVTIEMFSDDISSFVSFCIENLNDEDLYFASSCFSAIEFIFQSHAKEFIELIEPAIGILCEYSLRDVSPIYKTMFVELIDKKILSNCNEMNSLPENKEDEKAEEEEEEGENEYKFVLNSFSSPPILITSISLRILSHLAKYDIDYCNLLGQHIIQCCIVQSNSFSIVCQKAAAFSIGNLAEGMAMARNPSFDTFTDTMSFILYKIMVNLKYKITEEADVLSVIFTSASKIVEWHEYQSLGQYLKPILDFCFKLLLKITSKPSYDLNASKVAEIINLFLGMISLSAEDEAAHLMSGFLTFYIENLSNHSEHRFRSLASHFFADLMSSSLTSLDDEFKENVLSFSATLANEEDDHYAFVCLRDIAANEEEIDLAKSISSDVYQICMEKILSPIKKSKNFLLMRDNAVSTLALYGLNVIADELDLNEFLPPFLNALPIVLDFTENESVMKFFIWAFNKCSYEEGDKFLELFLRVLVIIFSNPPSVMSKLQLSQNLMSSLLDLLSQLLSKHPDPNDFVCKVLDGDEDRATILQEYLKDDEEDNDN